MNHNSCRFFISVLFTALLWIVPQQTQAQKSYLELAASGAAVSKNASAEDVTITAAPAAASAILTFFTDRSAFDLVTGGLPNEDFEDSNVPDAWLTECAGPFNSATNNACYSPGVLMSGFAVDNVNPAEGMVAITPGLLSNPTTVVGANQFVDDTHITFSTGTVGAAGFELVLIQGGPTWNVEFFGSGGSLGSTPATGSPGGSFIGALSNGPNIVRIEITPVGNPESGELIDNLCFGPAFDSDGDLVIDEFDLCPNTSIPELTVPSRSLGTNRWALVDADLEFDTSSPKGNGPGRSYNTTDTGGCSCEQIIAADGLGAGHTKFGCSIDVMDEWIAGVATGKRSNDAQSMVEASVEAEIPENFELSAAYPNPFNPQVQFTLQVAEDQHVGIRVYNLLGRQVAELHDGVMAQGHLSTFTFEASNLPTGTYLIRTVGETFQATRRVVLLK